MKISLLLEKGAIATCPKSVIDDIEIHQSTMSLLSVTSGQSGGVAALEVSRASEREQVNRHSRFRCFEQVMGVDGQSEVFIC